MFKRSDIEAIKYHKARMKRTQERDEAIAMLFVLFVGGFVCLAVAWSLS
jgi:hypothetical protein